MLWPFKQCVKADWTLAMPAGYTHDLEHEVRSFTVSVPDGSPACVHTPGGRGTCGGDGGTLEGCQWRGQPLPAGGAAAGGHQHRVRLCQFVQHTLMDVLEPHCTVRNIISPSLLLDCVCGVTGNA